MAEIVLEDRPNVAPWIVLGGELDGPDSADLLDTARAVPDGVVTIDARALRSLSPEGCEVLRYVGDDLADQGRRVRVVYRPGSSVEEALAATGTLRHSTLEFADGGAADPP